MNFVLCFFISITICTLHTPYWFKPQHSHPFQAEPIRILIVNDSPKEITVTPKLDFLEGKKIWTHKLLVSENVSVKSSVGYRFFFQSESLGEHTFTLLPGKHIYSIMHILKGHPEPAMIVRAVSTIMKPGHKIGKSNYEPIWRDAIRSAAFRLGVGLCFCGAGNQSSSYSVETPSRELPFLRDPLKCACDKTIAYNFLLPCNHGVYANQDMLELTNCSNFDEKARKGTRIHIVEGITLQPNRICDKSLLWSSLSQYYGRDKASLIMPPSYNLKDCTPLDTNCDRLLLSRIIQAENQNSQNPNFFIIKNANLHRQEGILLTDGEDVLNLQFREKGFQFATKFLDRPFLVNAFKLNMRRYVLIVCSGTSHLRAYVHQNGKNFYTKLPYRELSRTTPKFDWKNDNGASKMVLDEIITTAYNIPENHYHDKPMTNRNFFRLLDEKRINYTTFLQSLHTRIALSLHMASFNNSNAFGVCETRTTPECLSQALRSIHVACDFHVEQPTMMDGEEVLIGSKSLLFECNRGPDMNPHDPEDGALKREVSSDFVSLLGFSGELNDSEEILDRYQLAKVYDSHHFDSEKALGFLQSLSLLEQERTSKLELKILCG